MKASGLGAFKTHIYERVYIVYCIPTSFFQVRVPDQSTALQSISTKKPSSLLLGKFKSPVSTTILVAKLGSVFSLSIFFYYVLLWIFCHFMVENRVLF